MTKFKLFVYAAISLLYSNAHAVDNQITVLGVYTGGVNVSVATSHLLRVKTSWQASPISSPVGVTLANAGAPALLQASPLTGTPTSQVQQAKGLVFLDTLRTLHGADVIIVYTAAFSDPTICGRAGQDNWTSFDEFGEPDGSQGVFVPNASGMDLNGSETGYVAVVTANTTGACAELYNSGHEFGHLLGGGHEGTQNLWLNSDSHAYVEIDPGIFSGETTGTKSLMATASPSACASVGIVCTLNPVFSSNSFGNSSARNVNTMAQTALSVANYRVAAQCTVATPTNLQGVLFGQCISEGFTDHWIWWSDSCPSASDTFEIWGAQPVVVPYTYQWTTLSGSVLSEYVSVRGNDALIKVRACNNQTGCSGLSSSFYYAQALSCP